MTIENIEPLLVNKISSAKVPTSWGEFTCHVFESDSIEHLAFVSGDLPDKNNVLVRIHSECVTGDIFQSRKCDCGAQLHYAMQAIADEGGVLIYLRGQEGRGIGIGHKINAYSLQEQGLDTVQANQALGLPIDDREYGVGAKILNELGVKSMRLITNNPAKVLDLQSYGLGIVDRISVRANPTQENIAYLRTKNEKMGHLIDGLETFTGVGVD